MALPSPIMRRKSTIESPTAASRRGSFLMDLRDELQQQYESDAERERLHQVRVIHRILNKSPEARSVTDIDTLYEFVLSNGSTHTIFEGAQEIICKTICREMTLLELPAGGVVCYQGDYGDTFFVIVDGSVSLFIDAKKQKNDELGIAAMVPEKHDQYLQSSTTSASTSRVNDSDGNVLPENHGAFIKSISAGGTFGELAVMDPTARRSCTITCDAPTSFICLKRAAYQRLIRITNSSQLDFTTVEYLETLFFFTAWPHGELTRLANRLRHLHFRADTYLTRVGADANVMFFIYAGVVQETVPLVHYLNANGTVYKCARLETGASKRSIQEAAMATPPSAIGNGGLGIGGGPGAGGVASRRRPTKDTKHLLQKKRIALELNVYQDHDVCGEFPLVCNKHVCNTDLLAVTDVKTLIMDRETWKELFFMHGLEHIRDAHHKFRGLADARERWRETRTKLALANPGLVLTLSTKALMHDGQCLCGWCGSRAHVTGDTTCAAMTAAKKQQVDKQQRGKQASSSAKRAFELGLLKAQAIKNTLAFVHTIAGDVQQQQQQQSERRHELSTTLSAAVRTESSKIVASAALTTTAAVPVPRPPSSGSARRVNFQVTAKRIVSSDTNDSSSALRHTSNQHDSAVAAVSPIVPFNPATRASNQHTTESTLQLTHVPDTLSSPVAVVVAPVSTARATVRKSAITDASATTSSTLPPTAAQPHKVEAIRKSAFASHVASCYRETLVRKMKRLSTLQDFYDARSDVLEAIETIETVRPSGAGANSTRPDDNDAAAADAARVRAAAVAQLQPRKPKIPKALRGRCTKSRQPRPDRFNRKINRMLTKLRQQERPLAVVDESLQDF